MHTTKITTVEEAIDAAHYTLDNARCDDVLVFLSGASAKDILTFVQRLTITKHDMYLPFARAVLDIRLAEDAAQTAAKLATQTERLVSETLELRRFTNGVFWLTAILVLVAILQIYQIFSHN